MAPKRNCLVEALARNPRGAVAGDGPPLGPQPIAGADEVAVPNRRTNREKVADLKCQGLTQAQVVKALGICKSRVSQLWPRTPEVQAVFAEEHAAEVREATAQRSFADVEVRPADLKIWVLIPKPHQMQVAHCGNDCLARETSRRLNRIQSGHCCRGCDGPGASSSLASRRPRASASSRTDMLYKLCRSRPHARVIRRRKM